MKLLQRFKDHIAIQRAQRKERRFYKTMRKLYGYSAEWPVNYSQEWTRLYSVHREMRERYRDKWLLPKIEER